MSLDLSDSRFHFSQTPSVAAFEAKSINRIQCPHPECLSHGESRCSNEAHLTRVKVEAGEDYCIHHSCTWTENDGEHFARNADVCPSCNGLVANHGIHEARECLSWLISHGMTDFEEEQIVPYEVNE